MRQGALRLTAIVVVVVLFVGVVAGAFLLSSGPADANPVGALRAAAQQTLDAPSVRTISSVDGVLTDLEDFIAPDRLRMATQPDGSAHPTPYLIEIGSTAFVRITCTAHSQRITRWFRNPHAQTAPGSANVRIAVAMVNSAADARRVDHTDRTDRYEFAPKLSDDESSGADFGDASAVVADGHLRSVSFSATYATPDGTKRSRGRITFSRYGTVPPIQTPPASQITEENCSDLGLYAGAPPNK